MNGKYHLQFKTLGTCLLLGFATMIFADESPTPPPGTMLGGKPNNNIEPVFTPVAYKPVDKQTETENIVKKAYDYVQAKGKKVALDEFNKKNGLFTEGASYVFAMDYKGTMLASGYDQALVGKNQYDKKDIEGKSINREMIAKAEAGGGWTLYRWTNPETNIIACKRSYVLPMEGDYFIASGYYIAPTVDGKCELP